MTIREHVKSIQEEVVKGDLLPGRASELLNTLSALIGNINDEIRVRDVEYARTLLRELEGRDKANRAKIVAECSPEYQAKEEARDTKEVALQMIGSLKYYLRAKEEEFRIGGNQ